MTRPPSLSSLEHTSFLLCAIAENDVNLFISTSTYLKISECRYFDLIVTTLQNPTLMKDMMPRNCAEVTTVNGGFK